MFAKKRIKQLEFELAGQKEKNKRLLESLANIEKEIKIIANKIDPAPVKTYTIDAKEFARELQKYPKIKKCGGGGCGIKYEIPILVIDKVGAEVTNG